MVRGMTAEADEGEADVLAFVQGRVGKSVEGAVAVAAGGGGGGGSCLGHVKRGTIAQVRVQLGAGQVAKDRLRHF